MELQGRGREDGETTSDDEETYSETANRGGGSTFEEDTQGKEYSTSEDEEEEDQWNERMEEDAEEGVKRIGRLPENLLQPFLANTHPTQQQHVHQELELEYSHDHSGEDDEYSMRQARSSSSSSEGEEDLRSSSDLKEYAPYTPLMRWRSSDNDASHRKEREATDDYDEENSDSEDQEMMVRQQLPSERKTSVKELRDKFARGRILETVKRKEEEEEEELSHIPEDLRQFFRNTSSSKKESFIDEVEQAEISIMVNRFKQEEEDEIRRQDEEDTSQVFGSDFGKKIEKEETSERVRRLSMERLSLFKIPS